MILVRCCGGTIESKEFNLESYILFIVIEPNEMLVNFEARKCLIELILIYILNFNLFDSSKRIDKTKLLDN
jgi:hypothetical protein